MSGIETLAIASLAVSAVGAGVGAYSSIQQGQAAKAQAEYEAQVAEQNAKLDDLRKAQTLTQSEIEKQNLAVRTAQLRGQGRNAYASSGVALGSGSSLNWDLSVAEQQAIESYMIDQNTSNAIFGIGVDQFNQNASAAGYRAAGANAVNSSYLQAGGSLLAGAGSVASKYYQLNRVGVFG